MEASDSLIHRIPHGSMESVVSVINSAYSRGVKGLLFATNSLAQAGMREICHNGWRIPEDFMIGAFDSNDAFELEMLDIVYVQQPAAQFGYEVVDLMMKVLDNKHRKNDDTQTRIILNPHLVEKHPHRFLEEN